MAEARLAQLKAFWALHRGLVEERLRAAEQALPVQPLMDAVPARARAAAPVC